MENENDNNNNNNYRLWSRLELKEYSNKLVFTSIESPDQGFSIHFAAAVDDDDDGNNSNDITIIHHQQDDDEEEDDCVVPNKVSIIYGIVGTITLLTGTYVLVITCVKQVGTYLGFPLFQVTSMKFLPCCCYPHPLTTQEKADQDYFLTLLKIVESTPGLYFSYATDITINLQRRCNLAKGWNTKPIWKQGDPRFIWNKFIFEQLIENKLDRFIIPLLQGSFQTGDLKLKNSPAAVKLISRRCTRRLGTRMWRRGANLDGDTANFIETEQLLEFDGHISSFLQVRGSIPLLWEQIVDLSYKPRLNIINHEQTSKVVERHFNDILQRYGSCVAVDLTDKHGDEGLLSNAYAEEMQKLPSVRYVAFDFHQSCGNGNFDNIHLLYDQIAEDFEKQGYFLQDSEANVLEEQEGIIRSNCIDCLDRTNVTQSYLAQKSLDSQLQRVGAFSSTESILMFTEDYETYKTLWVEHGDEISLEYSGTHALKRDLVRYGKQTMTGIIKDGMSAISRYYLNNFQDGARQDAIDLISGRYTVNRNSSSPFQPKGMESLTYLPVASALVIGGLTVTSITLNQAGRNAQHYLSSMVCAGLTAGLMALVKSNGRQICSKPRLCGLL